VAIRASGVAAGKQRRNERPRQKLSNTLDRAFCLEAFEEAVRTTGTAPKLFNT